MGKDVQDCVFKECKAVAVGPSRKPVARKFRWDVLLLHRFYTKLQEKGLSLGRI